MADDILNELRRGNRLEKEGEFRLDPEKAREKLRLFRLPDPHRWVLEIVSAANLLGADTVTFRVDADEVEAHFDGDEFQPEDLADFYNSAFRTTKTPRDIAVRQLAIGFTAAEGLSPSVLVIESGAIAVHLGPGNGEITQIPPRKGTRIYCKETFRTAHIVEFFRNLRGNIAEKTYLRELCTFSTTTVVLDGKAISTGLKFDGKTPAIPILSDGVSGMVRAAPAEGQSRIDYVQYGVLVEHETYRSHLGYRAVVEASQLRRDMSNASFVRDDAFKRVKSAISAAQLEAAHAYLSGIHPSEWRKHPGLEDFYVQVIRALLKKRKQGAAVDEGIQRLLDLLDAFVIWPLADRPDDSQPMSYEAGPRNLVSMQAVKKTGAIYTSKTEHRQENIQRKRPVLLLTNRHLLNLTLDEVSAWLELPIEDVTEELSSQGLVSANAKALSQRPWPVELNASGSQHIFRREIGACTISVGLSTGGEPAVAWVQSGYLLAKKANPLPFDIHISGRVAANALITGPAEDDTNRGLASAAVLATLQLFDPIAKTKGEPSNVVRRAARAAIMALVAGEFHTALFKSLGFDDYAAEFWNKYALPTSAFALFNYEAQGVTLDSVIDRMGGLAHVRVFERVDGRGSHSLREIIDATKNSKLYVVSYDDRDRLFTINAKVPDDGVFVWTDAKLDKCLLQLCGKSVKPGLDVITSQAYKNAFSQRPRVAFGIPDIERYAIHKEFETHHVTLSLAWRPPDTHSGQGRLLVRYFFQERVLAERTFHAIFGEFTAHVTGNPVKPRFDFQDVNQSKAISKIEIAIRDKTWEVLIDWLRAQLEAAPRDQHPMASHTLDMIVFNEPRRLRALKFLELTNGEVVSPDELLRRADTIAFTENDQVVHEFVPTGVPVVRARRTQLESIFPEDSLIDCTAREHIVDAIQRNRHRFQQRPVVDVSTPPEALATATFENDEFSATLWLLRDADPANSPRFVATRVVFAQRVLTEMSIEVRYGRFSAVVQGTGLRPDVNTFDRVAEIPKDFEKLLAQLAQTCLIEYLKNNGHEDAGMFWYMWRTASQDPVSFWPEAHKLLVELPFFELADGSKVGYRAVQELAKRHGFVPWAGRGESTSGVRASEVVVIERQRNLVTLFPHVPWRHVVSLRSAAVSDAAPLIVEQVSDHAARALNEFRQWLQTIPWPQADIVQAQSMALTIGEADGKYLFSSQNGALMLDTMHPVGSELLRGNSRMMSFAASSFFSTLATKFSIVDRNGELEWQHALAKAISNHSAI
ncbi:MAG: hypothetical protein R3E66_20480 [bacterium]